MDLENASGLIRYLSQVTEASAVDLRIVVPTYERLKRTLEEMKDAGLIEIEYEASPRIRYTYRLTEKGRKAAKKIMELDDIINS